MNDKFSSRVKQVIIYSREEAERLGNTSIGPEHLLLGVFRDGEGPAMELLLGLGADITRMKKNIEMRVRTDTVSFFNQDIPVTKESEDILKYIFLEARVLKVSVFDTDLLLLAILRHRKNIAAEILESEGITYTAVVNRIKNGAAGHGDFIEDSSRYVDSVSDNTPVEDGDFESDAEPYSQNQHNSQKTAGQSRQEDRKTPALDTFGYDMTKAAREGRLDPVVGRGKEIERLVQIVSRRKKNNPILIGEPGVGKSAIVEGLAIRITERRVPYTLFDKRVVSLDIASVIAGTKYRGQFEERVKAIVSEMSKNPDIILFIDEIHTIVGAGGAQGSLDAANMLKPSLARGEMQCIGATTLDEYRKHIEKDGALERRFQKIIVEPTTKEETLEILKRVRTKYEEHHNVKYTDDALEACVNYTDRYITDRQFPDKAIDALDEAGARMRNSAGEGLPDYIVSMEKTAENLLEERNNSFRAGDYALASNYRDREAILRKEILSETQKWQEGLKTQPGKIVDEDVVLDVVSLMSGVPVQKMNQDENLKLLNLDNALKGKVIGQDDAVTKVVKAIRRNRIGLKDPNRPIGSFIFLGPTGVGKTLLAKELVKELFESPDALIRVDMSEFMEKHSVSKLIGSPPGYVGYDEGGQLTERVRRKPYSVVLFDEIEKAHADVFNVLLQVLDEGRLTDSQGRLVDFKNTVVIMTSNAGTRQLKDFGGGIGYSRQEKSDDKAFAHSVMNKALTKTFSPEFLNRIDDVVIFDQLTKDSIFKIIDIELNGVRSRIEELGFEFRLTDAAKDYIAEKGYDIQYGARPLKRAVQKYVEDEVADLIIRGGVSVGDTIEVGFEADAVRASVVPCVKKIEEIEEVDV